MVRAATSSIDKRPLCEVCKSNKADVVDNNYYKCANCYNKEHHIEEKLKDLKNKRG